jgi:hypothetical protein
VAACKLKTPGSAGARPLSKAAAAAGGAHVTGPSALTRVEYMSRMSGAAGDKAPTAASCTTDMVGVAAQSRAPDLIPKLLASLVAYVSAGDGLHSLEQPVALSCCWLHSLTAWLQAAAGQVAAPLIGRWVLAQARRFTGRCSSMCSLTSYSPCVPCVLVPNALAMRKLLTTALLVQTQHCWQHT